MKNYHIVLLGVFLILTGCSPVDGRFDDLPTTTEIQINTPEVQGIIPTGVIQPTINPTEIVVDPIEIESDVPPTPTPRSPVLPEYFELPDWIADNSVEIISVGEIDHRENRTIFSFIDPLSQRNFTLEFPTAASSYPNWKFTEDHELFFEYRITRRYGNFEVTDFIEKVNIRDGEITREEFGEDRANASEISDGYISEVWETEGTDKVFIQNLEDNTEIELIDPFEGKYADNTYISWSPSGEFLAVERISWADAMFEPPDTGLAIYTRDGEIYRLFDEVPFVDWSPNNGNQFLSTKERDLGEILPCIYDISSGEIDCLDEVSEWQTEKGVSVTSFKWHPVENKLSFIYWDYGPDRGGMCFIDLETSKINCPIDPSENGDRPFVVSYDWSPSGEYAYIFIDYYGPYGDDRFDMQLATIAKDGSDFRIWDLGRSSPKWKPLLEN